MTSLHTALTRDAGIEVPLIGGAMFPCSNPELVAAVSEAGAIGIVQPLSMEYVHGRELREGLRLIRRLTAKPVGMNVLIEQSSRLYLRRMERYVDIALDEGVRFFITSLGKPAWVVARAGQVGGLVYHDVTERKWALKGLDAGVRGLIAVNNARAGTPARRAPSSWRTSSAIWACPSCARAGSATPPSSSRPSDWATRACSSAPASSPPLSVPPIRTTSAPSSRPATTTSCLPSASPACRSP
jgi:nitronate monooxygenase